MPAALVRPASSKYVPDGWWLAEDVRRAFGISAETLALLRKERILVPRRKNHRGHHLYADADVRKAHERHLDGSLIGAVQSTTRMGFTRGAYPTDEGVRAFRRLREGANAVDLVLELSVHPETAMRMVRDYIAASGAILLPVELVDRVNAMAALPGRFPIRGGADLVDVLGKCAEDRACASCSGPLGGVCEACAIASSRKTEAQPAEEERAGVV